MPPSSVLRLYRGRENHNDNEEEDDDLALFSEVQNKERDSFLLQPDYDLNDIFYTKVKKLPRDCKIGDLLNEADKNEYDWLMTPPESPLFSSPDDDILHRSRGRARSQPVSISRSMSCRSAKGSPGPRCLSPSSRSGSNTMLLQSRGRPSSSASSHSGTNTRLLRASPSPSRRLSLSPCKPSVPEISATQVPRWMSTGSRGVSPVRTSSASPKNRAWQLDIPGFSSEAPPNLRTSLADRPRSYVRNSSRVSRKSMSPTARSFSSSRSHERDRFSSYTRGSIASSGDGDVDMRPSDHSAQRNIGSFSNSRSPCLSKKSTKILSSFAPERTSELALRQGNKKAPHNMFRPLLSSAPSSTHVRKGNTRPISLTSANSSFTTSSNASSDHGTSVPLGIVEAEHNGIDASRMSRSFAGDELFYMDEAEAPNENGHIRVTDHSRNDDQSSISNILSLDYVGITSDGIYNYGSMDEAPSLELCSKCHIGFSSIELVMDGGRWLCRKCKSSEENPTSIVPSETVIDASPTGIDVNNEIFSCDVSEQLTPITANMAEMKSCADGKQKQLLDCYLNSKLDIHEGNGISLLLKRSNSDRHIVPSRSCTTNNSSYSELFYLRESFRSLRSSGGRSSTSISSSFDFGSSLCTEDHRHRKLGGSKSAMEKITKHKRSISLLSSAPDHMLLAPRIITSSSKDSFEAMVPNRSNQHPEVTCSGAQQQSRASEAAESDFICKTTNSGDNSLSSISTSEEQTLCEEGKNLSGNIMDSASEETSISNVHRTCSQREDSPHSSYYGVVDADEVIQTETKCDVSDMPIAESRSDDDGIEPSEESDVVVSVPQNSSHEEATMVPQRKDDSRNLTLEEATNVILLCSSIVHEIAYNAVDIAIKRETPQAAQKPATSSSPYPVCKELRSRTSVKRSSKIQKDQQKKPEMEVRSPQSVLADHEGKSTPKIVLSPANMSTTTTINVPPKLESKCNCAIM